MTDRERLVMFGHFHEGKSAALSASAVESEVNRGNPPEPGEQGPKVVLGCGIGKVSRYIFLLKTGASPCARCHHAAAPSERARRVRGCWASARVSSAHAVRTTLNFVGAAAEVYRAIGSAVGSLGLGSVRYGRTRSVILGKHANMTKQPLDRIGLAGDEVFARAVLKEVAEPPRESGHRERLADPPVLTPLEVLFRVSPRGQH